MQERIFTECVDIVGKACKPFMGKKIYVSTGAVDYDHISQRDIEFVDYESRPSRANLEVESGDVVFAKMQATRKTLLIDEGLAQNIYSTGFCAVRARKNILTNRCLYHLLTSDMFLSQKDKNCSGATQKAITNTGLEKISIKTPSIHEQDRIAEILDKITDIISKKNKQLCILDDVVKARFVELFGDPVLNEKGWETRPFLDMGSCKNGMNFHYEDSGVELNCLGVGDFKDYAVITNTELLPTVSLNEMPSEEYLLRDDDIVFVRSNGNKALVGRSVAVYPGDTPTTFSGFCIRYRKHDDSITIPYLLRVLKTDSIRKKMAGRGANIQNLNQQILGSLIIPVPPLNLQNQFEDFVKQVDKSKAVIQKNLDETQVLFDSLMQQYFG